MLRGLIYYILSIYRWILRCGYCRGFGIQSPSAYSFVRYVVNEHYPYYAYQQFDDLKCVSRKTNKLGRLFFRLSNYWQPHDVVIDNPIYATYVSAGCHSCSISNFEDFDFVDTSSNIMMLLDIDKMNESAIREKVLAFSSERLLLVLQGIHCNKQNWRLWHLFKSDERTGITYDLYHCGIVFFDKSKYKQDFKINF